MSTGDPNSGPKSFLTAALAAATFGISMVAEPTGSTALRGSQVTGPSEGFGGVGSDSALATLRSSDGALETLIQMGPALVPIATTAFSVLRSSCAHRRPVTVDTSKRDTEDVSPVIEDEEVLPDLVASRIRSAKQQQQQHDTEVDLT